MYTFTSLIPLIERYTLTMLTLGLPLGVSSDEPFMQERDRVDQIV